MLLKVGKAGTVQRSLRLSLTQIQGWQTYTKRKSGLVSLHVNTCSSLLDQRLDMDPSNLPCEDFMLFKTVRKVLQCLLWSSGITHTVILSLLYVTLCPPYYSFALDKM